MNVGTNQASHWLLLGIEICQRCTQTPLKARLLTPCFDRIISCLSTLRCRYTRRGVSCWLRRSKLRVSPALLLPARPSCPCKLQLQHHELCGPLVKQHVHPVEVLQNPHKAVGQPVGLGIGIVVRNGCLIAGRTPMETRWSENVGPF